MDCTHILYSNDYLHHANNNLILANGCTVTIGLDPILVENWDLVQVRSIDPFAEFKSSTLNNISSSLVGYTDGKINGLVLTLPELDLNVAYAVLSRGTAIKDSVLIRFLYDMRLKLGIWPLTGQQYIVLEYKYEVKYPPNIAEVKVIAPEDFDPTKQLLLYTLEYTGPNWPDDVYITDVQKASGTGGIQSGASMNPEMFVINAYYDNVGNSYPIVVKAPDESSIKFKIGETNVMSLTNDSISVSNLKISNVMDPDYPQDAANKAYVDSITLEQVRSNDNRVQGDIDINNYRIKNLSAPVEPHDAVPKFYVDDVIGAGWYNEFTADVNANNHSIYNLANPTLDQDAATKNYVDTADQNIMSQITNTINPEINNLSDELTAHENDHSNPHQVTLEQARSISNQLAGDIDANSHTIKNLADPVDDSDPVTKQYFYSHVPPVQFELRYLIQGTAQVGTKLVQSLVGHAGTIQYVKIYSDTAPDGADLIVDVNINGTTIFTDQSHRPSIASGAHFGETSTIDQNGFDANSRFSIDIDQVGSSTAGGNDLMITIGIMFT